MPIRPSPTVRGRRLRYELRRLREGRGLTIERVSELSGGDLRPPSVSRWETGDRRIRPTDLRLLLDVYEVQGEQREALLTLARQARERSWWQSYTTAAVPAGFLAFIGLEAEAASVHHYNAELVPGLLQTADYYRAVMQTTQAVGDEDEMEHKIAVRLRRQERLTGEDPLRLWAVLNESVIRRVVGGSETMRAQLEHVAEMAKLPNITVQVLPFRAGAHPAMDGSFLVFGFSEHGDPDVVYLESQKNSFYLEEPPQVEHYKVTFQHLMARAADPDESRTLLAQTAKELT